MKTEEEIFNAIINEDEELALKLIEENKDNIIKLKKEDIEEKILLPAILYNMEKVIIKLLSQDEFKKILNKSVKPFYSWNTRVLNYQKELETTDEHSFIESKFNLEKTLRILKILLDNSNDLELPNDFLFEIPLNPIKNKLTTATRNFDIFTEEALIEILKNKKVDKIINNKNYQDKTFLEKLVKNRDIEEAVNLIIDNKNFTELNNNQNDWYEDYFLWGLNVNNQNALTACLNMNCNGKINDIIKLRSLLRIVTDKNIDEKLVIDLLSYLLRYRDHLISKNERTEHIFNQVERITPLIISDIKKSELYNNAYEELILIAAMYGKVESFKTLINSTIPFSTNTYNLICDYAIRFPEKDEKTKELLEEALGFKSLEETFKRNTSKEDLTVNELANHIFMYYTTRRIVSPIQDIYTILPNIALENIISYFDNAQDIITELNKLEEKYGCRRTFPIIDRNIKRKKLSSLNQTREVYEYSMYRCFNPDTEENIKKQETAKKIAQHLLNNFELAKEEKNTSKPKIKQKKIPYKLKEILINYK